MRTKNIRNKGFSIIMAICLFATVSSTQRTKIYADDSEHLGKNIQTSVTISVEEGESPDYLITNEHSLQAALNDYSIQVIPIQKDIILTKALTIPDNRNSIFLKSATSNPVTLSIFEESMGVRHFELLNDTNLSFDNVILDGEGVGGGINVGNEYLETEIENNPAISVNITNPTIQNCSYSTGGGIWLLPNTSLDLHGGIIKNNYVDNGAQGIYLDKDSALVMEETILTDEKSGIAIQLGENSIFTMLSGSILKHKVGVVVMEDEAKFLLKNGIIKDNETGVKIEGVDSEFTMNGGIISDNKWYGVKGSAGVFTMNEGTIQNNISYGVLMEEGKFILNDGIIEDNSEGVDLYDTIFEMHGGSVRNNVDENTSGGTGIYIDISKDIIFPVITGGEIKGNSNLGMLINIYTGSKEIINLTIKGITISNNGLIDQFSTGGLNVFISKTEDQGKINVILEDTAIIGNKSASSPGGGLYVGGNISDVILKNIEIKNNHAFGGGGGILIDDNEFPSNLIIQGDTYFSGNIADQAYWIEKDTRAEAIALKTKYDTDYRQHVKSLSASPGDSASFSYPYNNYDIAFIGEEGTETSPGVGRIVFHDSTDISNLDYKIESTHKGDLLSSEGDKPVINIFNNVGSNYNLKLSYDPVKASDSIISDIIFALRKEDDTYSNLTAEVNHIIPLDEKYDDEDFIVTVPWIIEGKEDSDLLKLNFPTSRLNLVGKDINTMLYWSLELTP